MNSIEFPSDFPALPTYEAEWMAVYMEPIVQSGERLTIGVVAHDGTHTGGRLAISKKALECLYGDSADNLESMMSLALNQAMGFAKRGFRGEFSTGIHGVLLGKKRLAMGDDLDDVIDQAISLTSSLSNVHADDEHATHERASYWKRIRAEMESVNPSLVAHFNKPVDISVRGATISIPCDYFSSRVVANICSIKEGRGQSHHFVLASSRIMRLEQIQDHQGLIEHHQRPTLILVTPTQQRLEGFTPGARRTFENQMLLLRDAAETKRFPVEIVHSAVEGAKKIDELERTLKAANG